MGYKHDAIKGISWTSGIRVATRGFAFIKIAVLARVLSPSQFGIFGIATLILAFLEVLTETGINIFIVQSKKDLSHYINSAWVVSIIRGTVIAFAIILSAPFIASFFHTPNSLGIILFISIVPFIRGFINPSEALFQKKLRFNTEFWFRTAILLLDMTVSTTLAVLTHSVYSLVWGMIASSSLEVLLSFILLVPRPRFSIERAYFSEIFHNGKWVTASGFFNYLFHNADNIIVGRVLGTGALGVYQVAYSFSILPITEISDVFSRVTFPIFTQIAEDRRRLLRAFILVMVIITLLTVPFGVLLYFFPREIVMVVLGKKWLAAVSVLPILALFGTIRGISGSTSALFLAVGKQRYVTAVTFVSILGLIIPILPLVLRYGIVGAAISALIGSVVALPVMGYCCWKVFNETDKKS